MTIRKYQPSDCKNLADLFYNTVHTVTITDYTKEQRDAWATGDVDLEEWNKSFEKHYTLVALEGEKIVGFGDIDCTGYFDRLYIDAHYLRRGIATALCDLLENSVKRSITTHSSITAKPFFEKRGYKVIKEQHVVRQGIALTNYVMEKKRPVLNSKAFYPISKCIQRPENGL